MPPGEALPLGFRARCTLCRSVVARPQCEAWPGRRGGVSTATVCRPRVAVADGSSPRDMRAGTLSWPMCIAGLVNTRSPARMFSSARNPPGPAVATSRITPAWSSSTVTASDRMTMKSWPRSAHGTAPARPPSGVPHYCCAAAPAARRSAAPQAAGNKRVHRRRRRRVPGRLVTGLVRHKRHTGERMAVPEREPRMVREKEFELFRTDRGPTAPARASEPR
jgi:hypothetical protein